MSCFHVLDVFLESDDNVLVFKKLLGKISSTADGQTRRMRKKNRIKRKKTKDTFFVSFCKSVRANFVQFGGISFSY